VHAHSPIAATYVTAHDVTEAVRAASVTPGLFELLGVVPAWGRPFLNADAEAGTSSVAIIAEALARRVFGSPQEAIGRSLPADSGASTVVGVMPASFRFPTAAEEIWYPLRLAPDPKLPYRSGVRNIARLAPGVAFESAERAVEGRSAAVAAAPAEWPTGYTGPFDPGPVRLRRLTEMRRNESAAVIFAMLASAAVCLLLIACANAASLEMAGAARRARADAVQSALGASRGSIVRIAWLEGGVLLAGSAALALPLAAWGTSKLSANLTAAMRQAVTNPLDLDVRALAFMLAIAAAAVTMTSIPGARRLSRLSVLDALRDDTRVMPATRASARVRQLLMAAQVALSVLLLVGGLLYVRTYLARLGIERGFDDSGLITVEVSPARDAPRRGAALESAILERLRATPAVRAISRAQLLPPMTNAGATAPMSIEGRETPTERVMLASYSVDPEYFETLGLHIIAGRGFTAASPLDEMVVNEALARRFWPGGDAVGARFQMGGTRRRGVIVGVARDFRQDRIERAGIGVYVSYLRLPPTSTPLRFVARLDDEAMVASIASLVRSEAPRSVVRTETMAARYAHLDADKRLAASITTGFGGLALVVATAGIYGVMAFLVAGRSREIGIRMALGADRRAVQRLVFRSSLIAVGVGAAIGVAAALIASRWIASQLYGVTATDPPTYAAVCGLILATALAATWWPARRAANVDPALTLRAE
jgi:predicted permease